MASVHKRVHRGIVGYRAVWTEPGPSGTRRQRNRSFAKAADAKAFAAKMEQEVERRGVGDPQRYGTAQYLAHWLETLRDRGEKSPTTLEGYARCVDVACREIGTVPLAQLAPVHLDRAYGRLRKHGGRPRGKSKAARPLTARTVLNIHRVLHNAFEQARKWKLIAENPARDASAPTPEKSKARAFSTDEVPRLLREAGKDAETYAIVATLVTCGMRRSELLGLCRDAVDLEAGTLTIKRTVVAVDQRPVIRDRTKTASSCRTLAIPPQLVALLRAQLVRVEENMLAWGREYQREPLLVFPGLAGAPMRPIALTIKLRQLMRRAKITGQPVHGWRHTAATQLLDSGANIKTVQTRLGHSTPSITLQLYVHPVEQRDKEAAEHFGKLIERNSA